MKCYSKESLESCRPEGISALDTVDFCLGQLYKDKTHCITDEIVDRLTFEELIGALLLASDVIGDLPYKLSTGNSRTYLSGKKIRVQ